jgi:hypothetical protein
MRIWRRPSFYFLVVPFIGIAVGTLAHEAMGCGRECTGPLSGPVDKVALFVAYLFGYGLPIFMALAATVYACELAYFRMLRRREKTTTEGATTSPNEATNK